MAGNDNNKHQQRQLHQDWKLKVNCAYIFTCIHSGYCGQDRNKKTNQTYEVLKTS